MAINNSINAQQTGVQCQTSTGVWNGRTITAGTGISVSDGDGVAGNPTISATGSGGGLGTVLIYDDFFGEASVSNGGTGTSNLVARIAGGGTLTAPTGTAANPGIVRFTVSSGSNPALCIISGDSSLGGFIIGNGIVTMQWVFKLTQLSIAAQTFLFRVGLQDSSTATAAGAVNSGIYLEYTNAVNSGNWTLNCVNSGTKTTANSATAATTSFVNAKVVVNAAGTSAQFFINGTELANSPVATNLPATGITPCIYMVKTNGSGAVTADIDLMIFNISLTTPRPG